MPSSSRLALPILGTNVRDCNSAFGKLGFVISKRKLEVAISCVGPPAAPQKP